MVRAKNAMIGALIAANILLLCTVVIQMQTRRNDATAESAFKWTRNATAADIPMPSSGRMSPAVAAAQRISPAVVSVTAVQYVRGRAYDPFYDEFFGPFMPFNFQDQRIQQVPMMGSGFIIDKSGYVLTNHHVIEGASSVAVTLPDGREFAAKVVDADAYVDVAVLKIEGDNLPVAHLGTSRSNMIGEWVMAIGNPFGQFYDDPRPSVSVGVISATGRYFQPQSSGRSTRVYMDMIQTDAEINPGNSGGPLANLDGEVIGINTFIISRTGGSQGLGFAIPIDKARTIFEEVRRYGKIRTLLLDIEAQPLSRPLARHLNLSEQTQGALVARVDSNGPAQRAGLQVADVIVQVNERKVRSPEDLYAYFVTLQVGDKIEMKVMRDGKDRTLSYTVEEGR